MISWDGDIHDLSLVVDVEALELFASLLYTNLVVPELVLAQGIFGSLFLKISRLVLIVLTTVRLEHNFLHEELFFKHELLGAHVLVQVYEFRINLFIAIHLVLVVVQSSSLSEFLLLSLQLVLHPSVDHLHSFPVYLSSRESLLHCAKVEEPAEPVLVSFVNLFSIAIVELCVVREQSKSNGVLPLLNAIKVKASWAQINELDLLDAPVVLFNLLTVEGLKPLSFNVEG